MLKIMHIKLFIVTLILFNTYFYGYGCPNVHPQTHYCDADFVVVLIPIKKLVWTIGSHYLVDILENFKISKRGTNVLKKGLRIGLSSALVGFELDLNETYLITGKTANNNAYTSHCDHVKKNPTPYRKYAFENLYRHGCKCTIVYCKGDVICDQLSDPSACLVDTSKKPNCYSKYGYCFKETNNSCKWVMNDKLRECLDKHL